MCISSGAIGLWFYFDSENEDWTSNPFINFMFSKVNYSKEKYMFLFLETTKSSVMFAVANFNFTVLLNYKYHKDVCVFIF